MLLEKIRTYAAAQQVRKDGEKSRERAGEKMKIGDCFSLSLSLLHLLAPFDRGSRNQRRNALAALGKRVKNSIFSLINLRSFFFFSCLFLVSGLGYVHNKLTCV